MREGNEKEVRLENIDADLIDEVLRKIKGRDEKDMGCKPGLILGCFRSQNRRDNSECMECRHYTFLCKNYLKDYVEK